MASNSNIYCCLKGCTAQGGRVLDAEEARVNVRAFEVKPKLRAAMVVGWKEGGAATFHQACWISLVAATSGHKSQITLSDQERSMIQEAAKTAEYHDSKQTVANEAGRIANILKQSGYCIAFTGAGISTAAGIGDFRGINGKWTERSKVKNYGAQAAKQPAKSGIPPEKLRPTYTHEALVKLLEMGLLKFVISQNTDGLHRLSEVPVDSLSELHGNSFQEKCEKCDKRFERPFACRRSANPAVEKKCPRCRINHRTGRKCEEQGCDGYLMNTIINFGDYLEKSVLSSAMREAQRADAVLVLGSTLRVSPASDLVAMGQQPNRLIICNRQNTPYDLACLQTGPDNQPLGSRVFGDCDDLMRGIMAQLMSKEDLLTWEKDRQARMANYDKMRGDASKPTLAVKSPAK